MVERFLAKKNNRLLICIFLAHFFFAIALGVAVVGISVTLTSNQVPESYFGLFSVIEHIAAIIIGFLIPKIIKKISFLKFLFLVLLSFATVILMIPFYQSFLLWSLLISFFGIGWFSFFTIASSWLNIFISNHNRGLITSIKTFCISIGIALGTSMIKIFPSESYALYLTAVGAVLSAYFMLIFLRNIQPKKEEHHHVKFTHVMQDHPTLFYAKFLQEFITTTLFVFAILFGIKNGFSAEDAALFITAYTAGSILDKFIGLATDRSHINHLLNISVFSAICLMVLLIVFKSNYPILLTVFFLLRIPSALIYIAVPTAINNIYHASKKVSANIAIDMSSNAGAIIGAFATGITFQIFGVVGFVIPIIFACLIYFMICFLVREKDY